MPGRAAGCRAGVLLRALEACSVQLAARARLASRDLTLVRVQGLIALHTNPVLADSTAGLATTATAFAAIEVSLCMPALQLLGCSVAMLLEAEVLPAVLQRSILYDLKVQGPRLSALLLPRPQGLA